MTLSQRRRNPFFPAAGLALLAAAALGLNACQAPDDSDPNALSVGLAVPPAGFADAIIGSGYATPMSMAISPDNKIFILEKSGKIKIHGVAEPFLTLSVDQWDERGLSSMAFDPNWSNPKYVYVYYAVPGANRNRVSRFTVDAANPNKALAGSEVNLFDLSTLGGNGYHNGGGLAFGKNGYLYLATGDNRTPANGQDMTNQLGKLLRFSKVPGSVPGTPIIPADNPFMGLSGNNRAIWALGLRNPYTLAIQPGTDRVFVNDIGEKAYEELNDATQKGLNFGWPNSEGPTQQAGHMSPVGGYVNGFTAYGDYNRGDCAIIGATFYNPPSGSQFFPADYLGNYFYGDHCSRYIKRVNPATPGTPTLFATDAAGSSDQLMDLDAGPDGALYYLTKGGQLGRITYSGSLAPTISSGPASQLVSTGKPAVFTVVANGTNLKYEWFRNDAATPIAGATSATYTFTAALADNGAKFKVRVFNASGTVTSANAVLSVTSNQPPVPVIATPAETFLWTAGSTVSFSGSANDPENGALPGASLTWWVELIHGIHTHPQIGPVTGATGSFTVPVEAESDPDVGFRLTLEAKDANGMTAKVTRDIKPKTVILTVLSNPAGMKFKLDDQPKTAPFQFTSVVGMQRRLEGYAQAFNGQNYAFGSWSNGQPANHLFLTPAAQASYTVNYVTASVVSPVPGRMEAENFKTGGEGVGYHDLTPQNEGPGVFRTGEGVDIEAALDAGNGYNVGWTGAGEWIDYAINVATPGNYNLTMRVASGAAGTKTAVVKVGGVVKATFNYGGNLGWQGWENVVVNGVNLSAAGQQTLRVEMTTGNVNFNYLNFVSAGGGNLAPIASAGADRSVNVNTGVTLDGRSSSDPDNGPQALTYAWAKISGPAATLAGANTAQPSFTPASAGAYVFRLTVSDGALTATDDITVTATVPSAGIPLPGRIQAEDYQAGGPGVGYHDLTAGNTGGAYKADNVDIQVTTDAGGGHNVGWIEAGEWLDYDVNVAAAGTYALIARVASGNGGTKTVAFSVDGGAETNISFTDASGWQSWKNAVVLGVTLPAGNHWVRLRMVTGGMNLNYVDVAANLLANGDFASGLTGWTTSFMAPAVASIAIDAGAPKATITNAGTQSYHIQLWQPRGLVAGKAYTLDFDVKADAVPKQFKVVVENNGLWTKYVEAIQPSPAAANAWTHYTVTWTQGPTDAQGRVVFDLGAQNVNDIWIDNVLVR